MGFAVAGKDRGIGKDTHSAGRARPSRAGASDGIGGSRSRAGKRVSGPRRKWICEAVARGR